MSFSTFVHFVVRVQLLKKSVQNKCLPTLDDKEEEVRFEPDGVALKYSSLTAWYSSSKKVRMAYCVLFSFFRFTKRPNFHLPIMLFYTHLWSQAFYTIHTLAFFLHNFQFFKASALKYIIAAKKVSVRIRSSPC